jgi:hypothetical protein
VFKRTQKLIKLNLYAGYSSATGLGRIQNKFEKENNYIFKEVKYVFSKQQMSKSSAI